MRASRCRGAGFSLVEVLVSLLMVSVGILALAALLEAATRHARVSEQHAVATLLASDLADRLRANAAGARLGARGYDMTARDFPSPLPAARAACTGAAPCGPGELAKSDLAAWTARLRATLPRGSALVRFRAAVPPAPAAVDLWLGWADANALAATAATDGGGAECPDEWAGADSRVRCLYLEVVP